MCAPLSKSMGHTTFYVDVVMSFMQIHEEMDRAVIGLFFSLPYYIMMRFLCIRVWHHHSFAIITHQASTCSSSCRSIWSWVVTQHVWCVFSKLSIYFDICAEVYCISDDYVTSESCWLGILQLGQWWWGESVKGSKKGNDKGQHVASVLAPLLLGRTKR